MDGVLQLLSQNLKIVWTCLKQIFDWYLINGLTQDIYQSKSKRSIFIQTFLFYFVNFHKNVSEIKRLQTFDWVKTSSIVKLISTILSCVNYSDLELASRKISRYLDPLALNLNTKTHFKPLEKFHFIAVRKWTPTVLLLWFTDNTILTSQRSTPTNSTMFIILEWSHELSIYKNHYG